MSNSTPREQVDLLEKEKSKNRVIIETLNSRIIQFNTEIENYKNEMVRINSRISEINIEISETINQIKEVNTEIYILDEIIGEIYPK